MELPVALEVECFDDGFLSHIIAMKAKWVRRLLPADRVVDVGGMWGCNGYYSFLAASEGAREVILLDAFAPDRFRSLAPRFPAVSWIETDFFHAIYTGKLLDLGATAPADAMICYDILLHQPEPALFLWLMFKAFGLKRAVIANPVSRKSAKSNEIVFLPGRHEIPDALRGKMTVSPKMEDRSGWVWLLTHGFVLNCCEYAGLKVVDESLTPRWPGNEKLDYSIVLVEKSNS